MRRFQIRQCLDDACRFRHPWTEHDPPALRCPRCGKPVQLVVEQELSREASPSPSKKPGSGINLSALVDNVRSAFNVGSIFRCADGAGVAHLYLCGVSPTPVHPKVAKTALGAEQSVGWSYRPNAVDVAKQLKAEGRQLWALEDGTAAESVLAVALAPANSSLVLVTGNEITGVDPGVLAVCDRTVAIPMFGVKQSLNVAIAFGIAAYCVALSPHLRQLS